jgi:hypothetical protein
VSLKAARYAIFRLGRERQEAHVIAAPARMLNSAFDYVSKTWPGDKLSAAAGESAGAHQFVRQATSLSIRRLDLRSMKPFAQRLGITSGRQF